MNHQRDLSLLDILFISIKTRMHSSRMRTGRSLTVCWGLVPGGGGLWSGGGSAPGGCLVPGVSAPGGLVPGGVSQHALR